MTDDPSPEVVEALRLVWRFAEMGRFCPRSLLGDFSFVQQLIAAGLVEPVEEVRLTALGRQALGDWPKTARRT